jgi:hypothetical protein
MNAAGAAVDHHVITNMVWCHFHRGAGDCRLEEGRAGRLSYQSSICCGQGSNMHACT